MPLHLPLVVAALGPDRRVGVVELMVRPALDVLVAGLAALLVATLLVATLSPAALLAVLEVSLAVLSVTGLGLAALVALPAVLLDAVPTLLAVAAARLGVSLSGSVPVWLAGGLSHRC